MTTFTEKARVGDVLKREFDKLHNRETITVASGSASADTKLGLVVGKVTATNKYKPYDNDATDGSETAAGILLEQVDASAEDAKAVILARGPAVVAKESLVFGAAVTTDAEKTAAYADLANLGIIARTEIGGNPVSIS